MPTPYTVSLNSSLVKSTSVDRTTLMSFMKSVARLREGSRLEYNLATTTTQVFSELPLGGVETVRLLAIVTDQPIEVRLNDDGSDHTDIFQIGNSSEDPAGMVLIMETNITKVEVSNDFGNEAHIEYYVAGE